MHLNVVQRHPWDVEADVLAVTLPTADALPPYLAEIDRRLGGALTELRAVGAVRDTLWTSRLLPAREMAARLVLVVGVGDDSAVDHLGARRLGAVVVKGLAGVEVKTLALHVPGSLAGTGEGQAAMVELLTRGLVEGAEDPSTLYTERSDKLPPQLRSPSRTQMI